MHQSEVKLHWQKLGRDSARCVPTNLLQVPKLKRKSAEKFRCKGKIWTVRSTSRQEERAKEKDISQPFDLGTKDQQALDPGKCTSLKLFSSA